MERLLDFNPNLIRFAPAKILIADDIEYNRELLAAYLNFANIDLCFAADGEQALEIAETEHPDLILLDMKMPRMDGYEASRRLKGRSSTRHIRLLPSLLQY